MKNKYLNRFLVFNIFFIFLITSGCFFSCKKDPVENKTQVVLPKWDKSKGAVAVVFGMGYNEQSFTDYTIDLLSQKYGLFDDDGGILPIIYPDDFKVEGIVRVSKLKDLLKNQKLCGLIILGQVENMHYSLNTIKEEMKTDGNIEYPIFSFFSQDDMLGTEAACDLVIDFSEKTLIEQTSKDLIDVLAQKEATDNILNEDLLIGQMDELTLELGSKTSSMDLSITEEVGLQNMGEIPSILVEGVSGILTFSDKKNEGKKNIDIVTDIFNENWIVLPYFDAQTLLKSYNHFVLESKHE